MFKKIISVLLVISLSLSIFSILDIKAHADTSTVYIGNIYAQLPQEAAGKAGDVVDFLNALSDRLQEDEYKIPAVVDMDSVGVHTFDLSLQDGDLFKSDLSFSLNVPYEYKNLSNKLEPQKLCRHGFREYVSTATMFGLDSSLSQSTLCVNYADKQKFTLCAYVTETAFDRDLPQSNGIIDIRVWGPHNLTNGTQVETASGSVDVISLLFFVSRIHALYHTPAVWSDVLNKEAPRFISNDGNKDVETKYTVSVDGDTDTAFTFVTECTNPACYCLRMLNIVFYGMDPSTVLFSGSIKTRDILTFASCVMPLACGTSMRTIINSNIQYIADIRNTSSGTYDSRYNALLRPERGASFLNASKVTDTIEDMAGAATAALYSAAATSESMGGIAVDVTKNIVLAYRDKYKLSGKVSIPSNAWGETISTGGDRDYLGHDIFVEDLIKGPLSSYISPSGDNDTIIGDPGLYRIVSAYLDYLCNTQDFVLNAGLNSVKTSGRDMWYKKESSVCYIPTLKNFFHSVSNADLAASGGVVSYQSSNTQETFNFNAVKTDWQPFGVLDISSVSNTFHTVWQGYALFPQLIGIAKGQANRRAELTLTFGDKVTFSKEFQDVLRTDMHRVSLLYLLITGKFKEDATHSERVQSCVTIYKNMHKDVMSVDSDYISTSIVKPLENNLVMLCKELMYGYFTNMQGDRFESFYAKNVLMHPNYFYFAKTGSGDGSEDEYYTNIIATWKNDTDGMYDAAKYFSGADYVGYDKELLLAIREVLKGTWDKYLSVAVQIDESLKASGTAGSRYRKMMFMSAYGMSYSDWYYRSPTGGALTISMQQKLEGAIRNYKDLQERTSGSLWGDLPTLSARMDIIDLCARYCVPLDTCVGGVSVQSVCDVAANKDNIGWINIDELSAVQSPGKDVLLPGAVNYLSFVETAALGYETPGPYTAYQLMLLAECDQYSVEIFVRLFYKSSLNGGLRMSFSAADEMVQMLSAIHDVVIEHPCQYSYDIWSLPFGGVEILNNEPSSIESATTKIAPKLGIDGAEAMSKSETNAALQEYCDLFGDDVPLPTLSNLYALFLSYGIIGNIVTTVDIYNEKDPLSNLWIIDKGNVNFNSDWYTGRALSATYIPMQSNLYDPYTMLNYVDYDFIEGYHYNYGFMRKALKIDTSPDAAVDYFTTDQSGVQRVATLADLYNTEADIVLYIDTSFYNLTELAERQDKVFDRLASSLETDIRNGWDSFLSLFGITHEVDFRHALKWGETTQYSTEIANNISDLTWDAEYKEVTEKDEETGEEKPKEEVSNKKASYDAYFLDRSRINQYLTEPEYTPMRGFALVSAIYRSKETFNKMQEFNAKPEPVFISSPNLWCMPDTKREAKLTLYNYALVKNLKAMSTVGYESSMDMTSPLYMDIYGNISTESGIVVIPAASNATLHIERVGNTYEPINVGFLSSYGKGWSVPLNTNVDESFMSEFFVKNTKTGVWDIRAKTIRGTSLNFAKLSYADTSVRKTFRDWYLFDLVNAMTLDDWMALRIVHEVMRGAPAEYIDVDEEDLNTNRSLSKMGLLSAAKLDSIVKSLGWDDEGSLTSVPNISFIDNYQYVVVYIFKILFIIIMVALMLTVFIDSVKQQISWRTILKCVSTLLIGVGSVLLIPVSFSISYYQSNKLLLQDEASYIVMLNTEKNMSGREIGITEVTEPAKNTKVYIKLQDYDFDWISVLPQVIFGDSINAIDAQYNDFLKHSPIADAPNALLENDGIYMDVQDIFSTSIVNFSTNEKQMYQRVTVDPVASYYIPYYYFLDALIKNINDYNRDANIYAYSTKLMSGGYVKTINLVNAYFNSPEFLDDFNDILGLRQLYNWDGSIYVRNVFTPEKAQEARGSQWYTGTFITKGDLDKRLDIMDDYVKQWISENRNAIGRVTDETVLKCLAMDMALKYNALFGIPSANAYEIYNLSNTDLIRLTIADRNMTLEDSPMSYARFVYDVGGTPAVFASVFLVCVTLLTSAVRVILTVAIMVILILSVYINKILLRKQNNSIAGYLLTLLVVTGVNIVYALILKVSLAIPNTGLPPTVSIILQIIVQLVYVAFMVLVLLFALRDWKNFGYNKYQQVATNMKMSFNTFKERHSRNPNERRGSHSRGTNGWDYLDKMENSFRNKQRKVGKA